MKPAFLENISFVVNNKALRFSLVYLAIPLVGFIIQSCGFQLNRNQPRLPLQAKSLSFAKIENRTLEPGLDLELREKLTARFSVSNEIVITDSTQADLLISVSILASGINRKKFSLTDTQNYEYTFSTSGALSVVDNRDQNFFFNSLPVAGDYKIWRTTTELEEYTKQDGRSRSLESLSERVYQRLTQDF